jgi:hypothetical protein
MLNPSPRYQWTQTRQADLTRIRPQPNQRPTAAGADSRLTVSGRPDQSTNSFVRHYVEMVVVMFLGMFVLMAPAGWLLGAVGTSWSRLSPAMNVFVMALTMTVPMIGWMRYHGHAWRPNLEMAASMLVPTFAVMALLSAGVGTSGALMVPEHMGMLACMLVAMLVRRDEYSSAAHHGRCRTLAA